MGNKEARDDLEFSILDGKWTRQTIDVPELCLVICLYPCVYNLTRLIVKSNQIRLVFFRRMWLIWWKKKGLKKMEERKGKNHLFFFWGCNGVYLHVLSLFSFFFLCFFFFYFVF